MNDEEREIDWKAFRANRPHKNHKQPRRGQTTKADKPDPHKPVVNYEFSDRNLVPRRRPKFPSELKSSRAPQTNANQSGVSETQTVE